MFDLLSFIQYYIIIIYHVSCFSLDITIISCRVYNEAFLFDLRLKYP